MPIRTNRLASQQQATVSKLAICSTPLPGPTDVRLDLIERIKKCFDRANHSNSNPSEAQAAIRMASKIMEVHNIRLAQVMQYEDAKEKAQRAGLSEVNVSKPNGDGIVRYDAWVHDLVAAILIFFDCSAFSTQFQFKIVWSFYGIAEHTVTAAIIFERMYSLIIQGTVGMNGIAKRNSYCLGAAEGLCRIAEQGVAATEAKARKHEATALEKKVREEAAAREKEIARLQPMGISSTEIMDSAPDKNDESEAAEQRNISFGLSGSMYGANNNIDTKGDGSIKIGNSDYEDDGETWNGFSDSEDDDVIFLGENNQNRSLADYDIKDEPSIDAAIGDFEANLQQFIKRESQPSNLSSPTLAQLSHPHRPRSASPHDASLKMEISPNVKQEQATDVNMVDNDDEAQGQSAQQLTAFRQTTKNVADDWLKQQNIRVRKVKAKERSVRDREAYFQGKKDSKEINDQARRQRITAD